MSNKRLICSKHSRHVTRRSRAGWRPSIDFLCLNYRHQLRKMRINTNNRVFRTGRDIKEDLEHVGTRHGGIVGEIPDGSKFAAFCHVQQRMSH